MDAAKLLNDANWDDLVPVLLSHARSHIYDPYRLLPGARSAEDVVHDAVCRVFSGERRWDPVAQPDLEAYLKSVIDSMLSTNGLFGLTEWKSVVTLDDPEEWDRFESRFANLGGLCHDVEVVLTALCGSIRGDAELSAVLEAIVAGFDKPGDIAELTGIPADRVYELLRKLKQRRAETLKKLEAPHEP